MMCMRLLVPVWRIYRWSLYAKKDLLGTPCYSTYGHTYLNMGPMPRIDWHDKVDQLGLSTYHWTITPTSITSCRKFWGSPKASNAYIRNTELDHVAIRAGWDERHLLKPHGGRDQMFRLYGMWRATMCLGYTRMPQCQFWCFCFCLPGAWDAGRERRENVRHKARCSGCNGVSPCEFPTYLIV